MRLGRGVHNGVDAGHELVHDLGVVHVAEHKGHARIVVVLLEIRTRASHGETVEDGHASARLREQRIHQMGADEPGATGDEDVVGDHGTGGRRRAAV